MIYDVPQNISASIIVVYFLIINIIAFLICWHDKKMAIKGKWRIPESMLLLFAVIGGSAGLLSGMYICHHKTKKPVFKYGVPVIISLQILFILIFFAFSEV